MFILILFSSKMRFQFVSFTLLSIAATALARRSCGAPEPSNELRAAAIRFANSSREGDFQAQAAIVVDTYFHVISSGSSEAQGNVPDSKLQNQVRLNIIGYMFELEGSHNLISLKS